MIFRTRQICLSYTDADNVVLQQETESIHVSKFQLLLHSRPVGLGLRVEFLTSGVDHPADILASARDFDFSAFGVLPWLHRANVFSSFPVRRLPHNSSHSMTLLVETSRFALPDFREHTILSRIAAPRHFGSSCNCNMILVTSCMLTVWSCSFRSLLAGNQKRVCQ